jgi:hypothetical protein
VKETNRDKQTGNKRDIDRHLQKKRETETDRNIQGQAKRKEKAGEMFDN